MDVLWDSGPRTPDGLTVREVAEALRERGLAYTTVMTVLDRLAGKGMVQREREGRAWRYRAAASREAHIAQLMLDALDLGGSRDAALVRFARSVTGTEAEVLRTALTAEAGLTAAPAPQTGDPRPTGAPPQAGDQRGTEPQPATEPQLTTAPAQQAGAARTDEAVDRRG
jgi:predicted transcriptional regulator